MMPKIVLGMLSVFKSEVAEVVWRHEWLKALSFFILDFVVREPGHEWEEKETSLSENAASCKWQWKDLGLKGLSVF